MSFDGETAKTEQRIPVGYIPREIEGPHGSRLSPVGTLDVISLEKLEKVGYAEIGKQAGGIAFWKMES